MTRVSELATAVRASRRELSIAGVVVTWIAAGVWLDSHASIWPQRALGVVTWVVLLLILRGERRDVRAQVAIVILVATAIEYTASGLLGVYTYRLHNIPWFVPPGHGLLYLTALALGRSQLFALLRRAGDRRDHRRGRRLGALGPRASRRATTRSGRSSTSACCGFLLVGRAPLVYAGAFLICSYLELMGTSVGTWAWAPHDASGPARRRQPAERHPGRVLLLRRRRAGGLRRAAVAHRRRAARLRAIPLRARMALR